MLQYFTPDQSTSSSNVVNIITYAGKASTNHLIHQIVFSYSATPTGGRLYVEDGANIVFDIDITAAGPGPINFGDYPIVGLVGNQMRVIMSAAGSAISKLSVWHSTR